MIIIVAPMFEIIIVANKVGFTIAMEINTNVSMLSPVLWWCGVVLWPLCRPLASRFYSLPLPSHLKQRPKHI